MSDFKREERYIVVKLKDIDQEETEALREFIQSWQIPTRECVVVEPDWPNYEDTWQAIEDVANGKYKSPYELTEQQQARIAELEQRQPEWVCYTCNTVYPVESVKKVSDCMRPSGCGGILKPRSRTERLLEQRIAELEQRNNGLAATVEQLRYWAYVYQQNLGPNSYGLDKEDESAWKEIEALLNSTPQQNLNHVRREVAQMAYKQGFNVVWNEDFFDDFDEHNQLAEYHANDYANTKYPSGKE